MSFSYSNHFDLNHPLIKSIMGNIPSEKEAEYPYDDAPSTDDHENETHGVDPMDIGIGDRNRGNVNEDFSDVGPPVPLHILSSNKKEFQNPHHMQIHDELSNHYKFTNGSKHQANVNFTHVNKDSRGNSQSLGDQTHGAVKHKEENIHSELAPPEHYDTHYLRKYTDGSNAINLELHKTHKKIMSGSNIGHVAAGRKVQDHMEKWMSERVKHLDRGMAANKSPKSLSLYTGVKFNPHKLAKSNKILHLAAYTSTSIDPKIAVDFAKHDPEESDHHNPVRHAINVHWPKNSKGAYVAHFSAYPSEKEFVLPRNVGLKLTGTHEVVNHHDQIYHIHHAYPVYGHK